MNCLFNYNLAGNFIVIMTLWESSSWKYFDWSVECHENFIQTAASCGKVKGKNVKVAKFGWRRGDQVTNGSLQTQNLTLPSPELLRVQTTKLRCRKIMYVWFEKLYHSLCPYPIYKKLHKTTSNIKVEEWMSIYTHDFHLDDGFNFDRELSEWLKEKVSNIKAE